MPPLSLLAALLEEHEEEYEATTVLELLVKITIFVM